MKHCVYFVVPVWTVVFCSTLLAGQITLIDVVGGPGYIKDGPIEPVTLAVNNDQSPLNINFTTYRVIFTDTGVVDIGYQAAPTSGTTEYNFFLEIDNPSDDSWTQIVLQLGHLENNVFTRTPLDDALDFDAPEFDNNNFPSSFFPDFTQKSQILVMKGGTMPPGNSTTSFITIDVSDQPAGNFVLRIVPIVSGDFNSDGIVESGDLALLLGNWGSTTNPVEWTSNWDGFVDANELSNLLSHWGTGIFNPDPMDASVFVAIPEPAALSLLAMGGLALLRRRSK